MAVCLLLIDNEWSISAGTLVATSEAAAMPASLTQVPERTKPWRSLSQTADQVLTRDLGSGRAVTYVAVANVRLQNGGSLKVYQGGTGGAPAWSLVATFPAQDPDTRMAVCTFATITARHWKLEFVNGVPATPDYAECGYVGLGTAFSPTRACVVPVPWQPVDPSVKSSSVDGQQSYTTRTIYAAGAFLFRAINESDLTSFRSLYRSLGRKTPYFFSMDSSLGNQQWLMRIDSGLRVERRHVPGRYDLSYSWEEAR